MATVSRTPEQQLLAKIADAGRAMTNPLKTSTNPHYKSKFASLEETMAVVEPVLETYGLGHTTIFNGTCIQYQVWDIETGAMIFSSLDLKDIMQGLEGNVWQQIGQAFSYLRRYLSQAFWNLVPEDTDAQSAPSRAAAPAARRATPVASNGHGDTGAL